MSQYEKHTGRLTVSVNRNGMLDHSYHHGAMVACLTGWNDQCETVAHTLSVEELRDLHYMLGRAIAAVDEFKARQQVIRGSDTKTAV